MALPKLLITCGEPAGIGTEIVLKALTKNYPAHIIVAGDIHWMETLSHQMGLPIQLESINRVEESRTHHSGIIQVLHQTLPSLVTLGKLDASNAPYVYQQLDLAHTLAIQKQVDAIVTAPVHKFVLNHPQTPFTGHTDYFAKKSQTDHVVMMLASEKMRVALVTTHCPLREVANKISTDNIIAILKVCITALQHQGISHPHIKVAGLNPHAGEQGLLGQEDDQIITPAIQSVQSLNASITGPYPADTLFSEQTLTSTDLFLCMYHDQGLPVIKYASFGACANISLGLPYFRTSVDHGTALDIAHQFTASSSSLEYAIHYAIKMNTALS